MADAGMNNSTNGQMNDEIPEYMVENCRKIIRHLAKATVDLSWLEDYDVDMVEVIERFVEYEALKMLLDDDEFLPVFEEGDCIAHAEGMGTSMADALFALRNLHSEKENLFVTLLSVAMLSYENGVRDAAESKLTQEAMRSICARRATADERRRQLRELYNDLRPE